jgi:hypothetical protein
MPLRLMFLFILVAPFVGIIRVENGDFSPQTGLWGEPNGAAIAFAAYALFALMGVWWTTRGAIFRRMTPLGALSISGREAREFRMVALVLNLFLLLLTLIAFGGLSVLSGDVGKGEFRASLGGLGAPAYLTLKWLSPCVFAFSCALHVMAGRPRVGRLVLFVMGLVTFTIGLSWGFKTSGLLVLLPGFIILLWWARLGGFVWVGLMAMLAILIAFRLFDTLNDTVYENVFEFIFARLTVFLGDVPWFIWGQWVSGEQFPNYWITPLVAIGDQAFSAITGITRASPEQWIESHYGALVTYLCGVPPDHIIQGGHSVTGTPFAEGVIALGIAGIPVFGMLAGVITGFVFNRVSRALVSGRPLAAALWANYAVSCLFAWLNGGDIVQLFHISVLVGALVTRLFLSTAIVAVRVRQSVAALPRS